MMAIALCVASLQARADDTSKRAKVQELFTVMHVDRVSEQITGTVRRQLEASMHNLPGAAEATPAQKKLLNDYETNVMALVDGSVNWKVLQPQMVDLYSSTYTEPEIDGILSFYKSPVGQTMLAKSPELTEKSMAITQTKLQALQPKISEISQNFAKQYAAAQAPPAQSSPSKAAPATQGSPK